MTQEEAETQISELEGWKGKRIVVCISDVSSGVLESVPDPHDSRKWRRKGVGSLLFAKGGKPFLPPFHPPPSKRRAFFFAEEGEDESCLLLHLRDWGKAHGKMVDM